MKKHLIILLIIIILAAVLRFAGLSRFSPPLNRDEAGIGYNAYSLLLTGRDEHGVSWPLSFESIGDYKMPGYIYLTMIPVKIFGLSELAVRFWSALGGVLAVLAIYFLAKEVFANYFKNPNLVEKVALICAALLAINPWHIHYSRLGFEANLNLTLFLWGLFFLLQGLKNNKYLIVTSLLWSIMGFMYSSTFIFLPLFLLFLLILFIRQKKLSQLKNKGIILFSILIFISISIIAVKGVWQVSKAKQSITIFSDPYLIDRFNNLRGELQTTRPLWAKLRYNKITYFGPILLKNYLSHFSPGFLLANAIHHPWHAIYGQGYFYWLDVLAFLAGLILIIKKRVKNKFSTYLIGGWLLLSPIASAITVDAPHATRSLYFLPVFILIAGFGLYYLHEFISNKLFNQKYLVWSFIITLYFILLSKAVYQYLIIYPEHFDPKLFGGVKPAIIYANEVKSNKPIYMSEVSSSAYIYVLFYTQMDPKLVFQANWKAPDTAGLIHIEKVGQFNFTDKFPQVTQPALWIMRASQTAPEGFAKLKEFTNPRTGIIDWIIYEK